MRSFSKAHACNRNVTFLFQLAKAEKLKPMELELKKLEDLAEAIVSDFAYMKSREKLMRDTNGEFKSCMFLYRVTYIVPVS